MTTKPRRLIGAGAAVLLALLLETTAVRAQSLLIPTGVTEREVVGQAEAEGAAYDRPVSLSRKPSDRKCVAGIEHGPAESGEFTIGGMLSGLDAMRAGREGKVWWLPVHGALEMTLVVRGRSLTNPADTVRFTTSKVAWQTGAVPVEQRDYFFPSGITIPQPGRWLVIATSGVNWGCFILTVV